MPGFRGAEAKAKGHREMGSGGRPIQKRGGMNPAASGALEIRRLYEESSVYYPNKSTLCPRTSRAIPPVAGLSVEGSTLIIGEKWRSRS
jgi:hypothetical protein